MHSERTDADTPQPSGQETSNRKDIDSPRGRTTGFSTPVTTAPSGVPSPAADTIPQEFLSRTSGVSDPETLQFQRAIRALRRHWVLILLLGILFGSLVYLYEGVLNHPRIPAWLRIGPPKRYTASMSVTQVQAFTPTDLNLGLVQVKAIPVNMSDLGSVVRSREFLEKYLAVLQRKMEEPGAIDPRVQPHLAHYLESKGNSEKAILTATAVNQGIASISVSGTEPLLFPVLLESIVPVINEYGQEVRTSGIRKALETLSSVQEKTIREITTAERELQALELSLGVAEVKMISEQETKIHELRMEKVKLEIERERAKIALERYRRSVNYPALQKKFFLADDEDIEKVFASAGPARQRLLDLEKQWVDLLRTHTEVHPRVMLLREEIAATQKLLESPEYQTKLGKVPPLPTPTEESILRQILTLQQKIQSLTEAYDTVSEQLAAEEQSLQKKPAIPEPEPEDHVERKKRNDRDAKRVEVNALRQREMIIAKQIGELEVIKGQLDLLVDYAPASPPGPAILVSPKIKTDTILAFILGVSLGLAIAFFLELSDNRFHTPSDVFYHLRLNYLGVIPLWSRKEQVIIPPERPDSHISEVYAHLCNNIRYGRPGDPQRCLLVASATQGEGKSTTAVDISVRYALEGNNVLLIDMDMRRPKIHKVVDIISETATPKAGVTDYLLGNATFQEVIYGSIIPGLRLIPVGSKVRNPAKLLSSPALRKLLAEAEAAFDIVVMDCPAILPVVDATLIAPHVRGVLLVIAAEEVDIGAVRMALYRLQHVGAPIVGAVLNKVVERSTSYTYYGYRYRAGYYYSPYSKTYAYAETEAEATA